MLRRNVSTILIYAAVCFNLVLCLLYTRGLPVSAAWVVVSEVLILGIAMAFIVSRRSALDAVIPAALFVACNFVALWSFRQEIDVKGLRDILIVLAFLWLGLFYGSYSVAHRSMIGLVIVIAALGLFEWMFLEQFVAVFDVFGYYQSRGTVEIGAVAWNESGLFGSGIRPQGRGLLSFLGDHRVSSVFLEPVSMGNFAVILAAWGLSHESYDWRKIVGYVAAAALFTIAADARFASATVLLLTVVRVTAIWRSSLILAVLPVVVMAGLIAIPLIDSQATYDDTFYGRLLVSGWVLSTFGIGEWLGINTGEFMFFDAGYGYVFQTFGLVLGVVSWAAYCSIPMPSEMGRRMKFFGGLYIVLLLCISGTSLFSIKTGAVFWFCMGVLSRRSEVASVADPEGRPLEWNPRLVGPPILRAN